MSDASLIYESIFDNPVPVLPVKVEKVQISKFLKSDFHFSKKLVLFSSMKAL